MSREMLLGILSKSGINIPTSGQKKKFYQRKWWFWYANQRPKLELKNQNCRVCPPRLGGKHKVSIDLGFVGHQVARTGNFFKRVVHFTHAAIFNGSRSFSVLQECPGATWRPKEEAAKINEENPKRPQSCICQYRLLRQFDSDLTRLHDVLLPK